MRTLDRLFRRCAARAYFAAADVLWHVANAADAVTAWIERGTR